MKNVVNESSFSIRKFMLAPIFAFAAAALFLFLASLIAAFIDLPDLVINAIPFAASCISAFIAGFFASLSSSRSGWLSGIAASLIYSALLMCVSCIFINKDHGLSSFLIGAAKPVIFGAIGGIVGINSK